MSLANYNPPTAEVTFKGGSFSVRGLSLEDFSELVNERLDDIEALYTLWQQTGGGALGAGIADHFVLAVVRTLPAFAVKAISLASGESVEDVRRLTFPLQVDALTKIGSLTFEEVGGLENFVKTVGILMASVRMPSLPSAGAPGS